MLIDDLYFYLEFDGGECALDPGEPSNYLYSTQGRIVANTSDESTIEAGRFHLYYVDVCAALSAGRHPFDIFDAESATVDYFSAIFETDTFDVSAKLERMFKGNAGWGNVLILNRLELLPAYRQRNLGLIIMRRLIERFGAGAFVVAIKPFPLQYEYSSGRDYDWRSRLHLDALGGNEQRATKKLRDYYAKLGFKAMRGTPFMFRPAEGPLPELGLKR